MERKVNTFSKFYNFLEGSLLSNAFTSSAGTAPSL